MLEQGKGIPNAAPRCFGTRAHFGQARRRVARAGFCWLHFQFRSPGFISRLLARVNAVPGTASEMCWWLSQIASFSRRWTDIRARGNVN